MKETTLSHVVQHNDLICVLAARFGFDHEVRLIKGSWDRFKESMPLHLVVRKNLGKLFDPNCVGLLTTKLAWQLNCKVNVLAEAEFPEDSVPLSSEAICKLFQILALDEVKLEKLGKELSEDDVVAANNYLADEAERVAQESSQKRLKY